MKHKYLRTPEYDRDGERQKTLAQKRGRPGGYDPTVQTLALLQNEARAVYFGNLARRDNGVPPLRWNRPSGYSGG